MEYVKEDQILLYEELCARPLKEDERTKHIIRFRENIRLANLLANKYKNTKDNSINEEDVYQEAYLGLWKACIGFDESKGLEFSTYAVPMIQGQVLRMLRDCNSLKIPRAFLDIRSALRRHGFSLPLSDEEIDVLVAEGKISRHQIMSYAEVYVDSLDKPMDESDENSEASYRYVADSRYEPSYEFTEDEIEQIIDKILTYIKPQHRGLVEEWIYGVLAGEKVGQVALGKKYKISQAQASRILKAAISVVQMHGDEIRDLFGY